MSTFDRWLEKPYTDRAKQEADFENFCDIHDLDPDEQSSWDAFDAANEEVGPDPDDERELAWEREMDKEPRDYGD